MDSKSLFAPSAGRLRTLKRVLVVMLSIVIFVALVGFLALPPVIRSVAESKGSEILGRKVELREVAVNPFLLTVRLRGLSIGGREGKGVAFSLREAFVDAEVSSVWHRGVVLREIRLEGLHVAVAVDPAGRWDFADILARFAKEPTPKSSGEPARFSLNNISVDNASIDFSDGIRRAAHEVREMRLRVPFLSNLPVDVDTFVTPSFHARVNGRLLGMEGKSKVFQDSRETYLDMTLDDVDLVRYLPYNPVRSHVDLRSARLDVALRLSFKTTKGGAPSVVISGKAGLRDVSAVDDRGGDLVAWKSLDLALSSLDLPRRSAHLTTVALRSPAIRILRIPDGTLNVATLLLKDTAESAVPPAKAEDKVVAVKESPPFVVAVDNVVVDNGSVVWMDRAVGPEFRFPLTLPSIRMTGFTNEPGKRFEATVEAAGDAKERFGVRAGVVLSPFSARADVAAAKFSIPRFAPYFAPAIGFDIASGVLGFSGTVDLRDADGISAWRVDNAAVGVTGLSLRKRNESRDEFAKVESISVRDGAVDGMKRTVVVGEVASRGGTVNVRRGKDGAVDLSRLMPEEKKGTSDPASTASAEGAKRKTEDARKDPAWTVLMKKVAIDRYAFTFRDDAPSDPVTTTVGLSTLRAGNVGTAKGTKGTLALQAMVGASGRFNADGDVTLAPLSARLDLSLDGLDIVPFQPYFTDKVRVVVTSGAASVYGKVDADLSSDPMRISWKGGASVDRISVLDKSSTDEILRWKGLRVAGIDLTTAPLRLGIDEVTLDDWKVGIVVRKDGAVNLAEIAVRDNVATSSSPLPSAEPPAQPAVAIAGDNTLPASVRVGTVRLSRGTVEFIDRNEKFPFTTTLSALGGTVSGLSSDASLRADVDLAGTLDGAPLSVKGKINPLAKDLFVDLGVDFRSIDLSQFTPYSGRFIGKKVEKGQLSLDLRYLIEKRKLDSGNKVFLDQFTLGEPVESAEATKLPVSLALALLRDRKGAINLDIPVSGSLDDPKFSVWRVVLQVLGNLLVKAATSPFALIGSLVGGGEEMSFVAFQSGLATLDNASATKIDSIAKALVERPALKVDVVGFVDPEPDRDALRRKAFERKVKAAKAKAVARAGKASEQIDNVVVSAEEYPKYLEAAYREGDFTKARNLIGMVKTLPVPEMERVLYENTKVSDDGLRELARRRAVAVHERIVAMGGVEAGRVFIVEGRALEAPKKEKAPSARVDFSLK